MRRGIWCGLAVVVLAQPAAAQVGVVPAVDTVRARFIEAVRLKNADSLAAVAASDIVMPAGRDSVVIGKARFRDFWAPFFAGLGNDPNPYDIVPVETRQLAPDLVVDIGNYGPIGGPSVGTTFFVFKQYGPRWYIVYWRRQPGVLRPRTG